MSLDVHIQANPGPPRVGGAHKFVCAFDDNGYYWFLYPLFERLAEETGQWIDLYDGAVFGGETLDALARTLASARSLVEVQPAVWEVISGIRSVPVPVPEEVRCRIEKAKMIALLDGLEAGVRRARETGTYITFFGD